MGTDPRGTLMGMMRTTGSTSLLLFRPVRQNRKVEATPSGNPTRLKPHRAWVGVLARFPPLQGWPFLGLWRLRRRGEGEDAEKTDHTRPS
jgi:hypothetical protein